MNTASSLRDRGIVLIRIAMGWVFLCAGIEKFLNLDGGTPFSAAGFLQFGTAGSWPGVELAQGQILNPTHDFWAGLAANQGLISVINVLVVFGEVAIGAALILGLFTRFASLMGVIMLSLFYVAAWDFSLGIVNEQLMYAIITGSLGIIGAGQVFGLDAVLEKTDFVRKTPVLRYVLG
ncbi:MAG: DoxX family protein [Candidatus Limnocylindria bacterium]